jgi:hypothetical protein
MIVHVIMAEKIGLRDEAVLFGLFDSQLKR